jgi:hypothetical protein
MKAVLCFCLIAIVAFMALAEAETLSKSKTYGGVEKSTIDVRNIVKSKLQN